MKQTPPQWAIKQHLENSPNCEWLCTHSNLNNLGEVKTPPKTKSLDTPTIDKEQTLDEILNKFADSGCRLHTHHLCCFKLRLQEKAVKKAKQALLQWHKSKARSYVPERDEIVPQDSEEDMDTAFITGYNKAIDQTLKAIEESK